MTALTADINDYDPDLDLEFEDDDPFAGSPSAQFNDHSIIKNLNQDQEAAVESFLNFMLSNNTHYHLTGGAGTGKTFTLDYILKHGMEQYKDGCKLLGVPQEIKEIAFTATTNKAAEVLSVTLGRSVQTIHSFMGLKVQEDFKTGEQKIRITNNTVVKYNMLIVIDEASMIDKHLFKLLQQYTHKCKFLYVGDHCQMAPVFEKLSMIYNDQKFFSNLTIPMRNAGQPALMDICAQFRETVETGVFKPIKEVPGVIDFLDGNQMKQLVDMTFAKQNPTARILCFRNKQVQDYNSYIRNMRGLPPYFTEGEYLVVGAAYTRGLAKLAVEQVVRVTDNPFKEVEQTVQGEKFMTYELKLERSRGSELTVYVPSDPQHFHALMQYFVRQKNWTAYFYMRQQFPDLRQADASTVYKAQGSTYETVFVDLEDISRCNQADQVARMLYVAVSRPKNRLYFYGKLKPAYAG